MAKPLERNDAGMHRFMRLTLTYKGSISRAYVCHTDESKSVIVAKHSHIAVMARYMTERFRAPGCPGGIFAR